MGCQPRNGVCDKCGKYLPTGGGRVYTKGESELTGAVVWSRVVGEVLCPECAKEADDSIDNMLRPLLWFVGLPLLLGLIGWIISAIVSFFSR